MFLKLADSAGPFLTGRSEAARLREQILAAATVDVPAVVDLADIEAISPSFADEFFAKMPVDALDTGAVRFEHMTDDLRFIVETVVDQRRHDA